MEPIVVMGEALIDLVAEQDGRLTPHPGGGPFNTARTIARLDRPVRFVGGLSTDPYGERMAAMLREDGVLLDAAPRTSAPTTLALVDVDPAGVARYRFYTQGTSAALAPAVPARAGMLHVGTLGLVLEPLAAAVEAAVQAAEGLVFVDPNVRPAILSDPDAYRGRLSRVLARADVIKVSEEDLAWLSPGRAPLDAARALLGPAQAVLLTLGGDGAVAVTPRGELRASPPPITVADTIGAGDAFGGAFVAHWHERGTDVADDDALVAALEFACLVAARTCERPGASPPCRGEL